MFNLKTLDKFPTILKPRDIENILHINKTAVFRLIKSGKLKAIKCRNSYDIPKQYFLEFLETKLNTPIKGDINE